MVRIALVMGLLLGSATGATGAQAPCPNIDTTSDTCVCGRAWGRVAEITQVEYGVTTLAVQEELWPDAGPHSDTVTLPQVSGDVPGGRALLLAEGREGAFDPKPRLRISAADEVECQHAGGTFPVPLADVAALGLAADCRAQLRDAGMRNEVCSRGSGPVDPGDKDGGRLTGCGCAAGSGAAGAGAMGLLGLLAAVAALRARRR